MSDESTTEATDVTIDTNIIDIKNFEKIGDSVIDKRTKTPIRSKKSKKDETKQEVIIMQNFDQEFLRIIEENDFLRMSLIEERSKSKTLEKIVNKFIKNQAPIKDNS